MRRCAVVLAAAAALVAIAWPASAQLPKKAGLVQQQLIQARAQQQDAARLALATRIMDAREAASGKGPFASAYKQDWIRRLAQLPVERLRAIADRGPSANLAELYRQAAPPVAADGISPDIGDSKRDLTYTQVTPCRVADTRVVALPLASQSSRPFNITGDDDAYFTPQGGHQCGIPFGATAVSVNITVTGTQGFGWLRAYPYGGSSTASVINFATGNTLANGLVLPVCDPAAATCPMDVVLAADAAGTQVIIDVLGYFMTPTRLGLLRTGTMTETTSDTVFLPDDVSCADYYSVPVTVPGPGQIKVEAKAQAKMDHTQGTDTVLLFGVSTTSGACTGRGFEPGMYGLIWIPSGWPSVSDYTPENTAMLDFEAPSAGTYTVYLQGLGVGAAPDSVAFWYAAMNITYYPY